MNFPPSVRHPDFIAWLQQPGKPKAGTELPCRFITQGYGIPNGNEGCVPGRYPCLQFRVSCLKRSVSATVIAVQMGIEEKIQRTPLQYGSYQFYRLPCMRTVPAVHQHTGISIQAKNVVGRQPSAFENHNPRRQIVPAHSGETLLVTAWHAIRASGSCPHWSWANRPETRCISGACNR